VELPTELAAAGAFLSGVGSVLGAIFMLRSVRKRADAECEKRLAAFREGLKMRQEPE
jgi:hypothetical protein